MVNDGQTFSCYLSGQFSGSLQLSDQGAQIAVQSCYNEKQEPYRALEENESFYNNMYQIWELNSNIPRWNQEKVVLGENTYHRYQSFARGWVYAHMETSSPIDIVTCDDQLVGFIIPARNEGITVVLEGWEDCSNLSLWQDANVSPASYQVASLPVAQVPMRDGIQLATCVSLPKTDESKQFPSILIRTCYNMLNNKSVWDRYAARGYAVIVQDTRGREASQGEWMPFINEKDDGDDTLNWIASQPWSNGNVGMLGGSYLGYVQWAAAASGNPHLKAIVSQVTAGVPFVDLPRRGGCLESGIMAWCFMVAKQNTDASALQQENWTQLLRHRPIKEIPEKGLGISIPFFDAWMEHQENDAFWKKADWSLDSDKINIPALYISGWFDDDGPGTALAWQMNQQNNRKNQRMILGPWLHKTNSARQIHSVNLPENALRYDLDLLYLRWFDKFLKKVENNVDLEAKVEYYQLGENKWNTASQWPPESAELTPFYLWGSSHSRHGEINIHKQQMQENCSYVFDPKDPFPYIINVSENECAIPGEYTLSEKRQDVLLFTSNVLESPISIAGNIWATVYASSSCLDTDWVVRLTDVDMEGRSIKLSDGILRARYRHGFDRSALLTPGVMEEFTVKMTHVAHTFQKGHRLRVHITSGAENFIFPNSNTGENESTVATLLSATQTIGLGGNTPSCLYLPIVNNAYFSSTINKGYRK